MSSITIPQSIFIEGQWFDAHWLAEVVDDATGELVITATTTTQGRIIALRMTTDLVRQLRVMAGFDAVPKPQALTTDQQIDYICRQIQQAGENMRRAALILARADHEA